MAGFSKRAAEKMAAAYVAEVAEAGGRLSAEIVAARAALYVRIATAPSGTEIRVAGPALGRSAAAQTPAGARSAAESLRADILKRDAVRPLYEGIILTGDPERGVVVTVL